MRSVLAALVLLSVIPLNQAESADSRLDQIKRTKTIKLAYRSDATPFSYVKDGEPAGYTVDICKLLVASIERQLNIPPLKIEWVVSAGRPRLDLVADGTADLECGSSTVTLTRMKQVDFSFPTFVQSTGLVVRRSSGMKQAADLTGKTIAVIAGTTNEQAVLTINESAALKAKIVAVKDRAEGISLLESERVDALASDKLLLIGAQYKNPDELLMLPDNLSFEPYAIVLPRDDWGFRLAVNSGLAELYRRGTMVGVYDKWFSQAGFKPSALLEAISILGATPE